MSRIYKKNIAKIITYQSQLIPHASSQRLAQRIAFEFTVTDLLMQSSSPCFCLSDIKFRIQQLFLFWDTQQLQQIEYLLQRKLPLRKFITSLDNAIFCTISQSVIQSFFATYFRLSFSVCEDVYSFLFVPFFLYFKVKAYNKRRLAQLIKEEFGIDVDPKSLFDVQV